MNELTPWIDGRAFLEGPRWRSDGLYVSDMHAHEVLRIDPDGTSQIVAEVPGAPSGLGWLPDGRLLIVSMNDRKLLRLDPNGLVTAADISQLAPHPINDMVVDAHGHAFIGQFGFDLHGGGQSVTSALLRVDPDGSVHVAAEDMSMANGLVIDVDDATLIVAESSAARLTAFDLAADGTLSNRRLWAELPTAPDGICLDSESCVWVACPVGDQFLRVAQGGRIEQDIPVPGRHAIACALGGADGRTLFMLTSETLGAPEESAAKRASRIETVTVDTPGAMRP